MWTAIWMVLGFVLALAVLLFLGEPILDFVAEQLRERRTHRLALECERTKQVVLACRRDTLVWQSRELEHSTSSNEQAPQPPETLRPPAAPPRGLHPRQPALHATPPNDAPRCRCFAAIPRVRPSRDRHRLVSTIRLPPSAPQRRSRPRSHRRRRLRRLRTPARGQACAAFPSPLYPSEGIDDHHRLAPAVPGLLTARGACRRTALTLP